MQKLAAVYVDGVRARAYDTEPIPCCILGAGISLQFGESWNGLIRNVTFRGTREKTILNVHDSVWLPPEVIDAPNVLVQVGFTGVSADGTEVIPTLWADLGATRPAAPTDLDEGIEDQEPVPPVWAQLQADVKELGEQVKALGNSSGGLSITDDGDGNVTITASGSNQITDDGNGNVVIS